MAAIFESISYHLNNVQDQTWQWLSGLNREEWLVLLAIVCVCGFLSLRGMQGRRL
jgi:hypothetical protein